MSTRTLWSVFTAALALACTRDAPTGDADAPPAAAPSNPPAPERPNPAAPTAEDLRAMTRALADDAMEGRRPGTPGGARTVAYIIDRMTELGLAPAGEDGGWMQAVPMRDVAVDAARTHIETDHGGVRTALEFGTDIVISTFGAAGTHPLDADLVFVGYGITAPQYRWDDYDGVDLDGKIAVVLVGDPPVNDGRFAGDALTYYGRWSYKFEEGLRHGATGVLIVHEAAAASYGWNVIETGWTHARTHVAAPGRPPPDALPVEGWLGTEAAAALAARCGTSLDTWRAAALESASAPSRGRSCGRLRGSFVTTESRLQDVNVIGRLEGARMAEQVVAITAHWDHLGKDADAPPSVDAIFNGAIDNASGIAGMLAVAATLHGRVASGRPLGRSVLFIATTGEEEGLLGSMWFVEKPTVPLDRIAAVVNLDSMNVQGRTRTIQVIGPGHTTIEDTLAEVATAEGRRVVPDEHPASGGYYRSDHFSFARRGVPAIYIRGGADMEAGGVTEGRRIGAGLAQRYHTVDDEFDEAWSFAGTLQDVRTVASLVARIADDPAPPQWKPTSEFADVPR